MLPDYLMGTIAESDRVELEDHLDSCAACRAESDQIEGVWGRMGLLGEEEPSSRLRAGFYAELENAARDLQRPRLGGFWQNLGTVAQAGLRPSFLQMVIPALFLVVGVVIGHLLTGPADSAGQVSQLHSELEQMKSLVTLSLLEQRSASERLRGVTWGTRLDQVDRRVLRALVNTLNSDPTVNVRLAAVDALKQQAEDEEVRDALVRSLSTQDSPLVQIALIDAMVDLQERRSVAVLRHLAGDRQLNQAVRDRAKWGMERLI